MTQNDNAVVNPSHYQTRDGIDAMSVIMAFTDDIQNAQYGFLMGNVIKYILRWHKKNGLEDLKKCRYYLDYLIDLVEAE